MSASHTVARKYVLLQFMLYGAASVSLQITSMLKKPDKIPITQEEFDNLHEQDRQKLTEAFNEGRKDTECCICANMATEALEDVSVYIDPSGTCMFGLGTRFGYMAVLTKTMGLCKKGDKLGRLKIGDPDKELLSIEKDHCVKGNGLYNNPGFKSLFPTLKRTEPNADHVRPACSSNNTGTHQCATPPAGSQLGRCYCESSKMKTCNAATGKCDDELYCKDCPGCSCLYGSNFPYCKCDSNEGESCATEGFCMRLCDEGSCGDHCRCRNGHKCDVESRSCIPKA